MHHLQRGAAPGCLAGFRAGAQNWSDVTTPQKREIWQALEAMQGQRCAYCEASAGAGGRHIEHFVQKGRMPQLTFTWNNLFGSCNCESSCGRHKDSAAQPYADVDLIKPDLEDPEQYFVFEPEGGVRARHGLSAMDARRAHETIRIFNLNGVLKAIRRREVMGYLQVAEEIAEFWAADPALGLQALADELAATARLPFATAIKHVLSNQSS